MPYPNLPPGGPIPPGMSFQLAEARAAAKRRQTEQRAAEKATKPTSKSASASRANAEQRSSTGACDMVDTAAGARNRDDPTSTPEAKRKSARLRTMMKMGAFSSKATQFDHEIEGLSRIPNDPQQPLQGVSALRAHVVAIAKAAGIKKDADVRVLIYESRFHETTGMTLVRAAGEVGAHVLVVGSEGHGSLGPALSDSASKGNGDGNRNNITDDWDRRTGATRGFEELGTTAHEVLLRAACSVCVVPPRQLRPTLEDLQREREEAERRQKAVEEAAEKARMQEEEFRLAQERERARLEEEQRRLMQLESSRSLKSQKSNKSTAKSDERSLKSSKSTKSVKKVSSSKGNKTPAQEEADAAEAEAERKLIEIEEAAEAAVAGSEMETEAEAEAERRRVEEEAERKINALTKPISWVCAVVAEGSGRTNIPATVSFFAKPGDSCQAWRVGLAEGPRGPVAREETTATLQTCAATLAALPHLKSGKAKLLLYPIPHQRDVAAFASWSRMSEEVRATQATQRRASRRMSVLGADEAQLKPNKSIMRDRSSPSRRHSSRGRRDKSPGTDRAGTADPLVTFRAASISFATVAEITKDPNTRLDVYTNPAELKRAIGLAWSTFATTYGADFVSVAHDAQLTAPIGQSSDEDPDHDHDHDHNQDEGSPMAKTRTTTTPPAPPTPAATSRTATTSPTSSTPHTTRPASRAELRNAIRSAQEQSRASITPWTPCSDDVVQLARVTTVPLLVLRDPRVTSLRTFAHDGVDAGSLFTTTVKNGSTDLQLDQGSSVGMGGTYTWPSPSVPSVEDTMRMKLDLQLHSSRMTISSWREMSPTRSRPGTSYGHVGTSMGQGERMGDLLASTHRFGSLDGHATSATTQHQLNFTNSAALYASLGRPTEPSEEVVGTPEKSHLGHSRLPSATKQVRGKMNPEYLLSPSHQGTLKSLFAATAGLQIGDRPQSPLASMRMARDARDRSTLRGNAPPLGLGGL